LDRAKVALQGALALARSLGSHTQLASALAEYARLNLAMSEHAAAARIAGLLRLLKLETRIPECDALIAEFEGRLPLLEDDLDAALLELINEPLFGALPF
jgi:hypothetical protein